MHTKTQQIQVNSKTKPAGSPRTFTPQYSHPVLQLQQQLGNQGVQRLLQSRRIQAKLTIGQPDDKYEQEADRVADQIMRMPDSIATEEGQTNLSNQTPVIQRVCPECEEELQRQPTEEIREIMRVEPFMIARQFGGRDSSGADSDWQSPGGMPEELPPGGGIPEEITRPLPPRPENQQVPDGQVCGPDVTAQLRIVISEINNAFYSNYNTQEKDAACDALYEVSSGALNSWDVIDLHLANWIYMNYRPQCATAGGNPGCGHTVQVNNQCYFPGTPNYVIYGKMCKLCRQHNNNTPEENEFSSRRMLERIDDYKRGVGNWEASRAWAQAGYDGWPNGGSPPVGDRANCNPVCARGGPARLDWRWCPNTDPAGQC